MEEIKASKPEPPPINKGEIVTEVLISWLRYNTGDNAEPCVELVKERDLFGQKKYGQRLMSDDGRNTVEDLRQELGDALQYAMKARIRGEDLSSMVPYLRALKILILNEDPK